MIVYETAEGFALIYSNRKEFFCSKDGWTRAQIEEMIHKLRKLGAIVSSPVAAWSY